MNKELESVERKKLECDGILNELAKSSETLKEQCVEIDEELEVHNFLLGGIEDLTEKNEEILERNLEKLDKLLKKYSNSSLMCTIFLLLAVLVLLLIF